MVRLKAGQERKRDEKKKNLESRAEGEKTRWERGEEKNLGEAFRGILFHSAGSLPLLLNLFGNRCTHVLGN